MAKLSSETVSGFNMNELYQNQRAVQFPFGRFTVVFALKIRNIRNNLTSCQVKMSLIFITENKLQLWVCATFIGCTFKFKNTIFNHLMLTFDVRSLSDYLLFPESFISSPFIFKGCCNQGWWKDPHYCFEVFNIVLGSTVFLAVNVRAPSL